MALRVYVGIVGIVLSACTAWAQVLDGKGAPIAFEAISVKESQGVRVPIQWQGARLVMSEIPLQTLLILAYGVPFHELATLPEWIRSERYEINAVASRAPDASEERLFIRALVEERFGVRTRTEMQEQPMYSLVVARPDRRLGTGLRTASVDCMALLRSNGAQTQTDGGPDCSMVISPVAGEYRRRGVPIALLTDALVTFLRRPVVDETALEGTFDIELRFRPLTAAADAGDVDLARPDIITAVEEQLGLKLEPGRASFPRVVFERIARPQPN